ncbi:hypothetical protein GCM10009563_20590 [Subtercola frigoramans]
MDHSASNHSATHHSAMSAYEIRLEGQLDPRWSDWFEGFTLTNGADGCTTLTGTVVDQAALHGLLRRVRDLGVTLLSVNALAGEEFAQL